MVSRRTAALLTVLLVVALLGYEVRDWNTPPSLEIENQDDREYRLVAHTLPGVDSPADLTFFATPANGTRRAFDTGTIGTGGPFYNVTLAADNATQQAIEVPPSASLHRTVHGWTHGQTTVYVLEHADTERLVIVRVVRCERGGQAHALTIRDGLVDQFVTTCS